VPKRRVRSNGAGSVYQRKSSDGRWVATLPFTRADGTPDRFTEYHRSKPEAEEAYRRMIAKRDAGLQLGTDRQTVEEFMEAWLSTSVKPNVREITYREYKSVVKTHIVPELGKRTLGSLTRQGLQLWVNGLSEKGLAPSTVGKVHIRLHAALEEAVHWDILSRNPADGLRLPRMRKTEAVVLDADQARALLKEIHGHRWEALFAVALAIGLRRGEICGMMSPARGEDARRQRLGGHRPCLYDAPGHGDLADHPVEAAPRSAGAGRLALHEAARPP
jgi:integrase